MPTTIAVRCNGQHNYSTGENWGSRLDLVCLHLNYSVTSVQWFIFFIGGCWAVSHTFKFHYKTLEHFTRAFQPTILQLRTLSDFSSLFIRSVHITVSRPSIKGHQTFVECGVHVCHTPIYQSRIRLSKSNYPVADKYARLGSSYWFSILSCISFGSVNCRKGKYLFTLRPVLLSDTHSASSGMPPSEFLFA